VVTGNRLIPDKSSTQVRKGSYQVTGGFTISRRFDYLKAGDSFGVFLDDFPTVTREQALGVLELMRERLLTDYETINLRPAQSPQ
jgi:hypothetical protein